MPQEFKDAMFFISARRIQKEGNSRVISVLYVQYVYRKTIRRLGCFCSSGLIMLLSKKFIVAADRKSCW